MYVSLCFLPKWWVFRSLLIWWEWLIWICILKMLLKSNFFPFHFLAICILLWKICCLFVQAFCMRILYFLDSFLALASISLVGSNFFICGRYIWEVHCLSSDLTTFNFLYYEVSVISALALSLLRKTFHNLTQVNCIKVTVLWFYFYNKFYCGMW